MILHTVNKARLLDNCLALCVPPASILLIEDGVYSATEGDLEDIAVYALQADVEARGLTNRLSDKITVVDDSGFVDLVASHSAVQSWY